MSNDLEQVQGSCLCGKVRFRLSGTAEAFHLCHCSRCRKASGSAHVANIFTEPGNISWLAGEEYIKRFELPEAKRFAKQFCSNCGSPLPYLNRTGTKLVIPAGSLDTPLKFAPDDNIFWASKAEWYEGGRDSPKFDGYPQS